MFELIQNTIDEHIKVAKQVESKLLHHIYTATVVINEAIKNGNKILICGNGGSASDAQHIAAEFTGRFEIERVALPAISLSTDTSALTAIGNDYGFDQIFARQVEALGQKGDVLLAISTSGNSTNIINAISKASKKNMKIIGMSGRDGGKMNDICDVNLVVPSEITARIQEMHILIGHILCKSVDETYKGNG